MSDKANKNRHNLEVSRKNSRASEAETEPYSSEIHEAQRLLEDLKKKKEEEAQAEERRQMIEERKNAFIVYHQEVVGKVSSTLPSIEGESAERQQELDDLGKAKKHFTTSLKNLQSYDPSAWTEKEVMELSEPYQEALERAAGEYEQYLSYIKKSGSKEKGRSKSVSVKASMPTSVPGFLNDIYRGFSFSLPIIVTLIILSLYVWGN